MAIESIIVLDGISQISHTQPCQPTLQIQEGCSPHGFFQTDALAFIVMQKLSWQGLHQCR
jgi:hypothetical protein